MISVSSAAHAQKLEKGEGEWQSGGGTSRDGKK